MTATTTVASLITTTSSPIVGGGEVQLPLEWDGALIFLSYVQAVQAAYTAIHILQLRVNRWLYVVGALCLSVSGIWSMHFIGMGALKIQANVTFDPAWTVASAIFAFIPCTIALLLVGEKVPIMAIKEIGVQAHIKAMKETPHHWMLLAGTCIATGVCAMHYCGMHAMATEAEHRLNWGVIVASILIAIFAGTAALYFAFVFPITRAFTLPTSLVAGVAVCGMHYTGMYGITYHFPDAASIPSTQSNQLVAIIKWIVFGSWLLSFCSLALATHLYRTNLKDAEQRAKHGVRFARKVSKLVAKYNMEKASRLCELVQGMVEENLRTQFVEMLAKLEPYKAYLPQSLFARNEDSGDQDDDDLLLLDSEEEEDPDDEGEMEKSMNNPEASYLRRKTKQSTTSWGDGEGELDEGSIRSDNSRGTSYSASSFGSSIHGGRSFRGRRQRSASISSGISMMSSSQQMSKDAATKMLQEVTKRKVTLLSVNLRGFHRLLNRSGVAAAVAAQAQLIKTCHTHVQANKGVIASVHGDRVFASFNAAASCAAHSRRAAIAALSIRDDMAEHHSLVQGTVSMGIDSAVAAVGAMGTSDVKSFSIVGPVVTKVQMLERLCATYENCQILMPSNLAAELGVDFTHRSVDILRDDQIVRAEMEEMMSKPDQEQLALLGGDEDDEGEVSGPSSSASPSENRSAAAVVEEGELASSDASEGSRGPLGSGVKIPLLPKNVSNPSLRSSSTGVSSSIVGLNSGVYAVSSLESVAASGVDNEWMYELQQNEREDPYNTLNQCFGQLVAGTVNLDSANNSISTVVASLKLPPQPPLLKSSQQGGGVTPLSSSQAAGQMNVAAATIPTSSNTAWRPLSNEEGMRLSTEGLKRCMSRPGNPGRGVPPFVRELGLYYSLIAK